MRRGAKNRTAISRDCPRPLVVGISASAGGLVALRTLLSRLPPTTGMAFVIVVHLSPEHESHLSELLQPCTPMPVQQVTGTVAVEPNHVYVIPPNANLSSIDTHLRLSELEPRRLERAPIDHFFRTLAQTHDGCSVAVVLTGGGSDGALGLRRIKEHGGLTIAQDPDEAEHDGMPRSAIATGMVDVVASLDAIPAELVRWHATRPKLQIREDGPVDDEQTGLLHDILYEIKAATGREFGILKPTSLLRRVSRRMRLKHVETLAEYLELLRTQAGEPRALSDDLMATVTEFFSDRELFERLERDVLPEIFASKPNYLDRVRVWSIGCSTGEEAYSLAILLLEAGAHHETKKAKVFASDVSEDLLRRAREGLYPHEVAATVPPERLERFFAEENGNYRVRCEVRDIVILAEHDLFRDPPYAHLDLIVCRKLLADLQPEVRRAVIGVFHCALEPNGFLIVGPNDSIDEPQLFSCEDAAVRLFRRKTTANRVPALPRTVRLGPDGVTTPAARGAVDLAALHLRLIERHAPPSILVDEAEQVVRFSHGAGRYVRAPAGKPTRSIVEMVREPLRSALRAALEHVRDGAPAYTSEPLAVLTESGARRVILHAEPVAEAAGMSLVVFREPDHAQSEDEQPTAESEVVLKLESDLVTANSRLRDLLSGDAYDRRLASASNEDLESANEELRFIMEELESSKEELQAANEELSTLDEENRQRIGELAQLSKDLQHLLESTGIATLFLDGDLNIVRVTPQAGELFNVRHADRGRPLADLKHGVLYDELYTDARSVLRGKGAVDREVAGTNGRWYLVRMAPNKSNDKAIDGVVLTLIDITDRKKAENDLREADRRKDEFLALLAHELRNPLAPITSGIDVLRAAGDNPRIVAQISTTMARQAQQLVRLVDDLLDVSRLSGGRLQLRKTAVALADILRDAVAAVRPLIERAGHELVVDVPAEPIVVDADDTRLTQVFANLLNNATRYTPAGGRIELAARLDAGFVVVTVRDNGYGISPDKLGHVFEMFYQGTDRCLAHNAGLGIGLTLAKSLVEMHAGTIAAASEGVDRGSTFSVRLPVAAVAGLGSVRPSATNGGPVSGRRVLIVDDNVDAAQTLSMVMAELGDNEIHTALSGAEALETGAELHPDIVLLDLKMPEMDGYEVARRIRAASWGKDVLLVALTGWAQEEHKRRSMEAGFDRHLTKPANEAALRAVLHEPRLTPSRLS